MNPRAEGATQRLEEGWTVEWTGWKISDSWPLKVARWIAFSDDKKWCVEAPVWVADNEEDRAVLGHAKDESRLRLRMNILRHETLKRGT